MFAVNCSLTGNCEIDAGTFIFFETWIWHCFVAFFLECNNNQSNENIYKKEWEHNEEHFFSIWRTIILCEHCSRQYSEIRNRSYVENRNFNSIIFQRSHIWFCCFYWIPKYIWPPWNIFENRPISSKPNSENFTGDFRGLLKSENSSQFLFKRWEIKAQNWKF